MNVYCYRSVMKRHTFCRSKKKTDIRSINVINRREQPITMSIYVVSVVTQSVTIYGDATYLIQVFSLRPTECSVLVKSPTGGCAIHDTVCDEIHSNKSS